MYTININDLKYLAVFFLAFKSYDNKQILNSVECITKNNLDVHYFVYLELDLKHVWDMNLASDFDAGNANFSA